MADARPLAAYALADLLAAGDDATPEAALLPPLPLLDLRPRAAVEARRLRGTVAIPPDEWLDRRAELPPRTVRYAVLYAADDAACTAAATELRRRFPADVAALVDAGRVDWAGAALARHVAAGPYPPCEQPRLWQPGPLAVELVARLAAGEWLPRQREAVAGRDDSPLPQQMRVLDAGSGMGRNAVYLAQEAPRALAQAAGADLAAKQAAPSVRVTAVENRWPLVDMSAAFAARLGVGGAVHCVLAEYADFLAACERANNNNTTDDANAAPPPHDTEFDAVLYARFMDKPSLPRLARTLLPRASPGLLLVEHFHASAAHPVDPAQTIAEGELLAAVSDTGGSGGGTWTQLLERRSTAEDGRPLLQVVLRHDPPPVAVDVQASTI